MSPLSAATKTKLAQAVDAISARSQPRMRTALGRVADYTPDANGRILTYLVDVTEGSGVTQHTILAGNSPQMGRGTFCTVYRWGDDFVGGWQLADNVSGFGTQTPAMVGGVTAVEPTLITGLGFHLPKGDGCIIVGGVLVTAEDGTKSVIGTRVRICANGVKGLTDNGNGDELAFMLATEDHTFYEQNVPYDIGAGDAQLGYRSKGHLYVDSDEGTFAWRVGTRTLFESALYDDLGITRMADLLILGDSLVGESITLGKDYSGAYSLQLLNKYNQSLIFMRAGFEDDPMRAYLRIGPPPPLPNIIASSLSDGTPVVYMHGGVIVDATVVSSKLSIAQLSQITNHLGVVSLGRAEFLQPGTVFNHWGDAGTATGLVIGFNDQTQRGELWGLTAGVKQLYFDSDGKGKWAGGKGVLDVDGLSFTHDAANFFFLDATPLVGTAALMYLDADSASLAINTGFKIVASGTVNAIYGSSVSQDAIAGVSTNNIGVSGSSTASIGVYGYSTNGTGIKAKTGNASGFSQTWHDTSNNIVGAMTSAGQLQLKVGIAKDNDGSLDEPLYVDIIDSNYTNDVFRHLVFRHTTTGTPAANFGSRFLYQLQSSATADQDAAAMDVLWTTATHASRTAAIKWSLVNSAAALAEFMRLTPTGLGIGVTPSYRLHVQSAAEVAIISRFTDATNYTIDMGYKASGQGYIRGAAGTQLFLGGNNTNILRLRGAVVTDPSAQISDTHALPDGTTANDYAASIQLTPTYTHGSGATLTKHHYFNINRPTLTNVTLTNGILFRFPAAAGTHEVVDAASTKTTPSGVDAWVKIDVNGTIMYIPAYTSKTA